MYGLALSKIVADVFSSPVRKNWELLLSPWHWLQHPRHTLKYDEKVFFLTFKSQQPLSRTLWYLKYNHIVEYPSTP